MFISEYSFTSHFEGIGKRWNDLVTNLALTFYKVPLAAKYLKRKGWEFWYLYPAEDHVDEFYDIFIDHVNWNRIIQNGFVSQGTLDMFYDKIEQAYKDVFLNEGDVGHVNLVLVDGKVKSV